MTDVSPEGVESLDKLSSLVMQSLLSYSTKEEEET
jgi:hypothetical protein